MTNVTINPKHVRPLIGSTVVPKTAGEDMVVGNLVYMFDDDTVKLTDADTLGTVSGRIGQIVAGGHHRASGAIVTGERVTVLEIGRVAYGPDADLDVAKQYYASNTAGKMGDVAGTNRRRVGAPESSVVFFFDPSSGVGDS